MSAGVKRNLQLGEEWLLAGDASEAERCFRKVLAREPRHPRALQVLGLLAHRRGERDRTVEALVGAARGRATRTPGPAARRSAPGPRGRR